MATNNNIRAFFQAVKTGSVNTLKELQLKIDPKELTKISKLFTHEGETPLLLAIRGCHLEMVKFLVEEVKVNMLQFGRLIWKGTMDYLEVPPLFAALIYDHIPEHSITNFMIEQQDHDELIKVMTSFSNSPIPRTQKIETFELIGAVCLLKKPFDEEMTESGLHFWKESLRLRHGDSSRPSIPKTPFHLPQHLLNVFGNATEFSTEEELEAIVFGDDNIFDFQTQALLVFHRIMDRNGSIPHPLFLRRLLEYSQDWLDLERTVGTAIFILEPFEARQWEDAVNFDWAFEIVKHALMQMLVTSCSMRSLTDDPELGFANVMKALNFTSSFVSKMRTHPELYIKTMSSVFVIIGQVKKLLPHFNQREEQECKKWVFDYFKNVEGTSSLGVSVLHHACVKYPVIPIDLIQFFLSAGANLNSVNAYGNTPLHTLAGNVKAENISAVLKLLLDSGAHLDKPNAKGLIPLFIFKHLLSEYKCQEVEGPNVFSLINVVRPLSCYCAKLICEENISFEREDVPPPVFDILRLHGANI